MPRKLQTDLKGSLQAAEERHRIVALELQRSWREKDEVRADLQGSIM